MHTPSPRPPSRCLTESLRCNRLSHTLAILWIPGTHCNTPRSIIPLTSNLLQCTFRLPVIHLRTLRATITAHSPASVSSSSSKLSDYPLQTTVTATFTTAASAATTTPVSVTRTPSPGHSEGRFKERLSFRAHSSVASAAPVPSSPLTRSSSSSSSQMRDCWSSSHIHVLSCSQTQRQGITGVIIHVSLEHFSTRDSMRVFDGGVMRPPRQQAHGVHMSSS